MSIRPGTALSATLARCAARRIDHPEIEIRVGAPSGPGWLTRAQALEPATLEALLTRVGRRAATAKRSVQGTWLLESYAAALVVPAALAALTEARVPDVGPANLTTRWSRDGEAIGVALRRPRGAALADDDEAALDPLATLVTDRAGLWAWYRERLVDHLGPLVDALGPVARRGPRALWACVEDACSGHLDWLGESLGQRPEAREQAALLLGAEAPLTGRAIFIELLSSRGAEVVRERNGCCLSYAREGRDGRACFTCPRTSTEERRRRREGRA